MQKLSAFIFFSMLFFQSLAQSFMVRNYSVPEGLPSSETYDVFQDSKGFMWFATDNGVVRFDGYDMTVFGTADGLEDPVVFGIMEDHRGRIWFRTYSGRLFFYENGKIVRYKCNDLLVKACSKTIMSSMFMDTKEQLWFASSRLFGRIDRKGNFFADSVSYQKIYYKTIEKGYILGNSLWPKKDEFPNIDLSPSPKNILDKWILSKIDHLIGAVEFNLEKYDVAKVVLAIEDFFINDLSLWYVRRSRKRFHDDSQDRPEAISTLYYVLLSITKLISPMMPFFAEEMYQSLKINNMPESVHLCSWPRLNEKGYVDLELEGKMDEARSIVNLALAERSEKSIKVRQPIALIKIKNKRLNINGEKEILELIKDEVNTKKIIFDTKIKSDLELDTKITQELKEEGIVRDIIRSIQDMRKKTRLKPEDKILVFFSGESGISRILEKNKEFVIKEIKAKDFYSEQKPGLKFDIEKEIEIDQQKLLLKIKKL
ncbi:MAG: class I tRNA ligase family protein [Candidatus Staskawiczbacteria bacterium]|nr:class I tRNA ligase family protein [Candidatus Staskawiczbacteria bacterium]